MTDAFQASSTAQGREFEDAVCTLLKVGGWDIVERHAIVDGAEVDIVADEPNGTRWWIECKGSWRGSTPGAKRGDTVKKAVAVAWWLSLVPNRKKYMLVTSHLPKEGTLSARMLDAALELGLYDAIRTPLGFVATADEDEL